MGAQANKASTAAGLYLDETVLRNHRPSARDEKHLSSPAVLRVSVCVRAVVTYVVGSKEFDSHSSGSACADVQTVITTMVQVHAVIKGLTALKQDLFRIEPESIDD